MADQRAFRTQILLSFGANAAEVEELLTYNQNPFDHSVCSQSVQLPLAPEAHIPVWQEYAAAARDVGVFGALQQRLVQFQFPVRAGISQTEAYRAATRKGMTTEGMAEATGLQLHYPDRLELWLHPSLAGVIPVLYTPDREDFVALVQALARRNEPHPLPESMGACIVNGFNNWDRVRRYRQAWEAQHSSATESEWTAEFQRLIPQKQQYQDRFLILSRGAYSGVPASDLGLTDSEWLQRSQTIRLEHECTHYLTHRLFQSMQNNLLDELIADYQGIVAAIGYYRADWFLRFLGLESFPHYREGGRLQNYRGKPPLSDRAFQILQALIRAAATHLECFDTQVVRQLPAVTSSLATLSLTHLTLEELAAPDAIARLQTILHQIRTEFTPQTASLPHAAIIPNPRIATESTL
jgi:hypothetical protein